MSTERARASTATEICACLRLDAQARALLAPAMTPRAYVEALLGSRQHVAAIEVVAQALPRRIGLWWAMLCAQHATQGQALEPIQTLLYRLALRWLVEPGEAVRVAAGAAAREAGAGTLGGLLGYAVAMHSADPGAAAVANAVKLASTMMPPPAMLETQRAYAVLGLHARVPEDVLAGARRATSALHCV